MYVCNDMCSLCNSVIILNVFISSHSVGLLEFPVLPVLVQTMLEKFFKVKDQLYSIEKCLPALLLCYNRVVESSILVNWIQQSETCELVLVIICISANCLLFLLLFCIGRI